MTDWKGKMKYLGRERNRDKGKRDQKGMGEKKELYF